MSFRGGLERPTGTDPIAELDMMPGRLGKVPVGFVWTGARTLFGAHTFRVRAFCGDVASRLDCNPGIVMTTCSGRKCVPVTSYNLDSASAGGVPQNAYVSRQVTDIPGATHVVRVYSENRATSAVERIEWSTDGVSWSALWNDAITGAVNAVDASQPQHVGGTMVKVGALQSGDGLEVRTPSRGFGDDATRLWLFSVGTAVPMQFSDAQSAQVGDPRVTVGAGWGDPRNYVLIGKDARAARKTAIESFVDLVRTPLDPGEVLMNMSTAGECADATCGTGDFTLPAGRYYVYFNVRLALGTALGDYGTTSAQHLSAAMGNIPGQDCYATSRGTGNDRVFTMTVRKGGALRSVRHVPRGLLGNDPALSNPWHYIIAEIDSDGTGPWRIDIDNHGAIFHPQWKVRRNPDANELKVASYNVAYYTALQHSKLRNAADLLGTRGTFDTAALAKREHPDRAPWQWEADVVGLQEIDDVGRADAFHGRLLDKTSMTWQMVYANTEISSDTFSKVWYGPIYANALVTPANGSILFDQEILRTHGCNSNWEGDTVRASYACDLGRDTTLIYNRYRRAVPARVAAKRLGGLDRPVVVFNWHLLSDDDSQQGRNNNVREMISRAEALILADPGSFNKNAVPDIKSSENRFIIIGDSNGMNHQCAEFAGWIHDLRAHFGYAVDVATATLDGSNRTWDTHYSGAPITDDRTGTFGSCTDPAWSDSGSQGGSSGLACPFKFQHRERWNLAPNFTTGSVFPWWAATSRPRAFATAGGTRFDTIILVGRGWSTDDPVVKYSVMSDRREPSPANDGRGGGVGHGFLCAGDTAECWDQLDQPLHDRCGNAASGSGYAPEVEFFECGTSPGAPALLSDHRAIGARLRLFAR